MLGLVAAFVLRSTRLEDFGRALERLPAWALAVGYCLGAVNIALGAVRWGVLMRTFGARAVAPLGEMLLATFIAHFYNTFIPGSFGGDLVRGYVTRKAFDAPATAVIVVFFERLVGLFALCLVAAVGLALGPPLLDYAAIAPYLGVGLGLGLAGALILAWSGRLNRFRAWLPRIARPRLLADALLISLVGHGINLGIYAMLARAMGLPIGLDALAAVVPIGLIATLLPLTLVGVGAREVALVGLLGVLGVAPADALIFTLGFALSSMGLAATGGAIQLLQPKVLRYH